MKKNTVILYGLEFVVFMAVETTLTFKQLHEEAKAFVEAGGVYEYDFIAQVEEKHGKDSIEVIQADGLDFENLEDYDEE